MRLARIVVRLAPSDRDGLDRLRARYFEETRRGLSRATIVRVLVARALDDAEGQRASAVIGEPSPTLAPRAVSMSLESPREPRASPDSGAPSPDRG